MPSSDADPASITVVVPTYQRREMVLDTVRALSQLEYEGEFEIVVVIDGSTDGTAAALAQLECPVPLRVVEQQNRGLAAARNRGAAEASGEIVLFLDDDMTCGPDLLHEHWRAYRGGADAVAGDFTEDVGAGGGIPPTGAERRNIQQHEGSLTPFDIFGGHLSVRRSAFQKVIQSVRKIGDIVDNLPLATRVGRAAPVSGAGTLTSDLSYYRRRASEERTAALNSRDPRVRRVHSDMADRYEERVRGMAAHHEMLFVPMTEPV